MEKNAFRVFNKTVLWCVRQMERDIPTIVTWGVSREPFYRVFTDFINTVECAHCRSDLVSAKNGLLLKRPDMKDIDWFGGIGSGPRCYNSIINV